MSYDEFLRVAKMIYESAWCDGVKAGLTMQPSDSMVKKLEGDFDLFRLKNAFPFAHHFGVETENENPI